MHPRRTGHFSFTRTLATAAVVAVVAVPAVLGTEAAAGAAVLAAPAGGSVPAISPSPRVGVVPSDSTDVRIAMTENDTQDVIVYSPGGVSAPGIANSPAVMFQRAGDQRTWTIWTATGCAGPDWVQLSAGQVTPVASPVTAAEPLQLCEADGNTTVDGTLTALYNSNGAARTVNTLPLEQYVADTVPGESPSYWATLGGTGPQSRDWGFQELEAQAVAVRSYVLSNIGGYGGYADTCDLTCQDYRGTEYVTPASIAAADDTAGEVMYMPDGQIATTEYSASTGGYTTGGPFQIVPDTGDAVHQPTGGTNPDHDWTATVPVSAIQSRWTTIGTFQGITTVVGNGYADPGESYSRVTSLAVVGTTGRATVGGATFAGDFTLKSDWFTVTSVTTGIVHLVGHGYGHGIGMGQWGALGYAIGTDGGQGNWTYQQILSHYYQPATLGNLPGPPVPVGASGGVGGYWLSAADGGIFSFGNARFYGSMGGHPLNEPVVGMAATPTGGGYWEVASDGGIFSFGNARFYGSMGGHPLNEPVVGMAATPTGGGYWEVASDGGIFSFGNARFYGSMGGHPLNRPVVGMAATPTGGGYWEVASDGGIFTFGGAAFSGSAAGTPGGLGAVALLPARAGDGYDVVNVLGTVTAFGDAPLLGDLTTAVSGYGGTVVGGATTG